VEGVLTLLLFDVDGTLFLTPDGLYLDALVESVREVWDHELTEQSFARAEHRPGETAMQGLRHLLVGEGLDRAAIDAGLGRWCSVFSERYVPLLERTPTPHWRAAPGAAKTLDELARTHDLALLTGNPEPVARARMTRLELDRFFAPGTGAFGCEAEERVDLVGLARRRSGDPPLAEIALVGDTPRDVEGAHAAGIRAIAVITGEYGRADLSAADDVLAALGELPGALR
jgi:phosphoglycolate phosphatase-like HAD superfamily hydrolase